MTELRVSVIQADMLTQEANYKQIQDAKAMVEDDLQHKLEEFEEERERLLKLAKAASTLERELEQVATLKSKNPLLNCFFCVSNIVIIYSVKKCYTI